MTIIDTPPDPFASVQTLLLIIGNARSGSTLVGSVIDAHPQAVVANETTASATFWRDTSRATILGEIQENSRRNRESGRQSEGYTYQVKKEIDSGRSLTVMGDKIWNPATLLLQGSRSRSSTPHPSRRERTLCVSLRRCNWFWMGLPDSIFCRGTQRKRIHFLTRDFKGRQK